MSKLSYTLIAIMAAALIFMGAVRGYQLYQRKAAQWEEERSHAQSAFSFQNVPVSLAAPQAEMMAFPVRFEAASQEDIFLEDVPLSQEQEVRQAQDTIASILEDYKDDAQLRAFNRDLAAASSGHAVDLSALSGGDLKQVLKANPKIGAVVSKHMQNPEFAKTVRQILSNPQFVKSVKDLQRAGAGAKTNKKVNK